jgi:hypothetical protein
MWERASEVAQHAQVAATPGLDGTGCALLAGTRDRGLDRLTETRSACLPDGVRQGQEVVVGRLGLDVLS